MSLLNGKFKLSVYRIVGELPEYDTILAGAQKLAAPPMTNTGADPQVGFASGAVLLDTEISAENSVFDDWLVLNLRRTQLKVNSGLLKATIQRDEQKYLKANNAEFVPRKVRGEIKEEALKRLLTGHAKVAVSGTEFAMRGDTLFIASQSSRECDEICMYLAKLGVRVCQDCATSKMMSKSEHSYWRAGRAFLTWLYKQIQVEGNEECWGIDGPLDLIADSGHCTQVALRGDMVTGSDEAIFLVDQEKKYLRKAKLIYAPAPESCWKCSFDADTWSFGSLELPETECFGDRMKTLGDFLIALDGRFAEFAETYKPTGE